MSCHWRTDFLLVSWRALLPSHWRAVMCSGQGQLYMVRKGKPLTQGEHGPETTPRDASFLADS